MRDLLLCLIVFGALPWCFMRPHLGLLMWSWLGYMNPHRLSWGFAYNFPFVQVAALATLVGMLFSREPKRLPMSGTTFIWLLWISWMSFTTLFALNPLEAVPEWQRMVKIQLMVLVTLLVINNRERIDWLVWCIAISIGFFGTKGGIFTLATGGSYRVWGPPGTFIEGNNEVALALLVIIPLMRYLQMNQTNKWLSRGLMASMVLCGFSVVGSYSRGALLGGAAMLLVLWLRSRNKIMTLIPLVVIAGGALAFMPAQWFERMNTINSYEEDGSAMGRINAWHFAYNLAKDRPILGGGFNAFSPELFHKYAPDPNDFHDAHSIYFEVLAEHGFVGLSLYLAMAFGVMIMGSVIRGRTKKHEELKWAHDLASMLQVRFAGFAVGGAFLGLAYFDLPYHLMAIMILVNAVVNDTLKRRSVEAAAATKPPNPYERAWGST
jgi:putative inorganic carbon (HCO3(-)) transporter